MTLQIHISQIGSVFSFNITDYLEDSDTATLNEQVERLAFERKHGDLTLKLSNMTGYFTTLFSDTLGSTRWEIVVRVDDTVRWRGELDTKRIEFSLRSEWVTLTAWSKTKLFWDRMKSMKIDVSIPDGQGYVTLRYWFDANEYFANLSDSGTIFSGFDLTTYETRRLRGTSYQPAPIGNEGRFFDLDRSQTYADLFEAFRIYYNCEFFINHDDRKLVMRRRNLATSGTAREIEVKDKEVRVSWIDADKVDYILTYAYMNSPSPIQVTLIPKFFDPALISRSGLAAGVHKWRIVFYEPNATPALISQDLQVTLPTPPSGYNCWWVELDVPVCSVNTITTRQVFRCPPTGTVYYWVKTITNNSSITRFTDGYGIVVLVTNPQMPQVRGTFDIYRSYDESTGTWRADIIATGSNAPSGRIFPVQPKLYWAEPADPTQRKPFSEYDIYSFFGRETNFETFSAQWIDEFRTKRRASLTVKGVDFTLNEPVVLGILPNDLTPSTSYLVKSFSSKMKSEETELTLLSI